MPLVRFQVRNEYGLGDPEVYRTSMKDEPAAILQGVSVAGLVGILRQLGDLAEFAADIFHDLHEQVTVTAARSHEMMTRVQHLEAALPPLENHILAQTSHLHFAYTAGSDWRADIRTDQNHLTRSDLPRFILDSYEECRGPPSLYLLDRFDTAGAGACLKKYSDPSFFKMHCASFELTKSEKIQKEKKAHKSKKKVRGQRNGEVPGTGSIIWNNSRNKFASLDADGQSYSVESIHTSDERSKSDQANGSPLIDSLTRTSNIERVFDADSSLKSEKESDLFTYVEKQYCDIGPSVAPDEQNAITRDSDLPHHLLHGRSSIESSVSWEEKAEIIEPTIELCDNIHEGHGEPSDPMPLSFDPPIMEQNASILKNSDQQDAFFGEKRPESSSGDTQSDGVVSDPDNYVDALNTMESEIESDSEHRTKRAIEIPVASYGSSNKEMSQGFSDSESSGGLTHSPSHHSTGIPSSADTDCVESCDVVEVLKEPDFASLTSDSLMDPNVHIAKPIISVDKIAKSEESPPAETTDVDSLKLWTNGGLFGVEPSKPPNFSAPNDHAIQNSESNIGRKESSLAIGTDEFAGEMGNLISSVEHTESSISCQVMGEDDRSVNLQSQNFVSAVSEPKLEKFEISQPSNAHINEARGVDSTKTSVVESSNEYGQNNFEASQLSSITNHDSVNSEGFRPFKNGKPSVVLGTPVAHEPSNEEKLEISSPRTSICPKYRYIEHPSPPLEHMKILFDPINDLEVSKLKLEFSNGDHLDEGIEDALFPSFHLLPGPMIPLPDIGSETDDDTFSRPSPSFSGDLLSQGYESNSEQWETRSKDEIYDGVLRRVSSATSISSSLGLEGMAHHPIQPYYEIGSSNIGEDTRSHSGQRSPVPLQGFPSFGASNSSMNHQGETGDLELEDLSGSALPVANGMSLPPPPLPPMQWRIMKPPFTLMEDKQNIIPDNANQPSDPQIPGSVSTEQFELATPETPQKKFIAAYDKKTPNQLGEPNESVIGKKPDEREVWLEQIRAKSFSLRRTTTARPNLMPAPTTNINVVAILEKANAIRQAFAGSDEGGDDDKWSDC